ncbi:MAG: PorP/SprF family type IX secretion system membrane protein [Bacteroidales bacterium]|jgi:type IX secretion system PorP/SprF family membrane protein
MAKLISKTSLAVVFVLSFTVAISTSLNAQDPIFSQFYNNPVYSNPGYIGLNPGMRARANYRTQWTGLTVPYKTLSFTADFAERAIPGSGGFGLVVNSDQAGIGMIKTTNIGLGTAARVPIYNNMVAQVGILVSFSQHMINWDDMVFGDELNPRFGRIYPTAFERPETNKVMYPDFGVGGVYRYVNTDGYAANVQVTVGAAVQHVFQPNQSFVGLAASNLPNKLVLTTDVVVDINQGRVSTYRASSSYSNFKLNPAFIYEKQKDFSTYTVGLNIFKSSIYLGAWFRNQNVNIFKTNDVIFSVGVNVPFSDDSRLRIMYSYDMITSDLKEAGKNAHEISLVYEFDQFSFFSGMGRSATPSYGSSGSRAREMECCPF